MMESKEKLERMLLAAAEAEHFGCWDDRLSVLVGEVLHRYPSDTLDEDILYLAAGGISPFWEHSDQP